MDIDPSKILVRYNVQKEKAQSPDQMAAEMFPKAEPARTIAKAIYDGEEDEVIEGLEKAIGKGADAIKLIDDVLMPGMKIVTDLYDQGVIFLPNVMMAADAMLEGIEYCKESSGSAPKPKGVVVCHVAEGDVHDIGKTIVAALLRADGYKVVDLGRDVPVDEVIAAVKKESPMMLTGTALMTTTMYAFKEINDRLLESGIHVPFQCGGGAVNQDFVASYQLGIYGEEAADAPKMANAILAGKGLAQLKDMFHKH